MIMAIIIILVCYEYPFIVSISLLASMNACFAAVSTMAISMPIAEQDVLAS